MISWRALLEMIVNEAEQYPTFRPLAGTSVVEPTQAQTRRILSLLNGALGKAARRTTIPASQKGMQHDVAVDRRRIISRKTRAQVPQQRFARGDPEVLEQVKSDRSPGHGRSWRRVGPSVPASSIGSPP